MSREKGLALVLTAVLGTIAFAVWALSFRATLDTVRAERYLVKRAARDGTVKLALGAALALLRTGTPPLEPISYRVAVGDDVVACTVTYTESKQKVWDVEARLSTEIETVTLPELPVSFDP